MIKHRRRVHLLVTDQGFLWEEQVGWDPKSSPAEGPRSRRWDGSLENSVRWTRIT